VGDNFAAPCVIGVFLLQCGWSKCTIGLHIGQPHEGGLLCIFFHTFRETPRAKTYAKDDDWLWQKNMDFFIFLSFFREIFYNIQFEDHCFMWLASCIEMNVRFKFYQNRMRNMVKIEFWTFLLEEIPMLEKKVLFYLEFYFSQKIKIFAFLKTSPPE